MFEEIKKKYYNSSFYYKYEKKHPELFLVSVLIPEESGLPVFIGIDETGSWEKHKNKNYIRVENSYDNILHIRKSIKLSIEKEPKLLSIRKIKISETDFKQVKKFVSDNYDKLIRLLKDENYTCLDFQEETHFNK